MTCFLRDPYQETSLISIDVRFLAFPKLSGKFGQCDKIYPAQTNACGYGQDLELSKQF